MKHLSITIFAVIVSSILSSCSSDNDSFETQPAAGASNTNTEIPDFNSFTLTSEKLAVEALNFVGFTSNITAHVADRHNNPVPDGTEISFLTNGGRVDQRCTTTNGDCSVTWKAQLPIPPDFQAKIIAYTTGEESFTDLNDNDNYDVGEIFTDISEPFFDINEDGVRDPLLEEFVDADSDNVFDGPDGLFTGTPCVGDNTVCNRISTLIWDSQNILLSGSFASNVTVDGLAPTGATHPSLPTTVDTSSVVFISILDTNSNPMADGTTVAIESSEGSVDPSEITLSPLGSSFNLVYTTGDTPGLIETLKITVTAPESNTESVILFFTGTLTP